MTMIWDEDLGEIRFLPALSATSVASDAWVSSNLLPILDNDNDGDGNDENDNEN